MTKVKIAIIGGTGLDNKPELIENRKESIITTAYGSVELIEGMIRGVECVSCKLTLRRSFSQTIIIIIGFVFQGAFISTR
jgi:purine nucleoside phosphorylase